MLYIKLEEKIRHGFLNQYLTPSQFFIIYEIHFLQLNKKTYSVITNSNQPNKKTTKKKNYTFINPVLYQHTSHDPHGYSLQVHYLKLILNKSKEIWH